MSGHPYTADGPEVVQAFTRALAAVEVVRKTQTADTGKYTYTYADLVDVLAEVKRVCQAFGLNLMQTVGVDDDNGDHLAVTTTLVNDDGQAITFTPTRLPLPRDPQALGSATTYLRRYSLVTIFAMPTPDDDGKDATQQARHEQATGYRSGAEERIHEVIKSLDPEAGKAFRGAFRERFGPLSELPVARHGEALEWSLAMVKPLDLTTEVQP